MANCSKQKNRQVTKRSIPYYVSRQTQRNKKSCNNVISLKRKCANVLTVYTEAAWQRGPIWKPS